jgi:hypothetical protein
MKLRFLGLSTILLLTVVWSIYFFSRQMAFNQFEEMNARLATKEVGPLPPEAFLSQSQGEGLLDTFDHPKSKIVQKVSLQLHSAAAKEFFRISGVTIDKMSQDYYYDVQTDSEEWITLTGESDQRKAATLVVAANVEPQKLAELIERRWKVEKKKWRRLSGINVQECATCEAYELKYGEETYAMIIGKGDKSNVSHAVAELAKTKNTSEIAADIGKRLHFSKSEAFQ